MADGGLFQPFRHTLFILACNVNFLDWNQLEQEVRSERSYIAIIGLPAKENRFIDTVGAGSRRNSQADHGVNRGETPLLQFRRRNFFLHATAPAWYPETFKFDS